jgi:hypothetical protein
MVHDVFKLEDIRVEWAKIAQKSSVKSPLAHKNVSPAHFSTSQLSNVHMRKIHELYAADFENFGYQT